MKNLLVICAAAALTLGAANAMAADVTGSWTGSMQAMDGNTVAITFNFKQDGANLTGTVVGPVGDPLPIANGKVDGDNLTFDVSFNGVTIHHNCTVTGDQMKMSTKTDSGDFPAMELSLKRAADAATPAAAAAPAATPASAVPAASASSDLTGNWTGQLNTPDGNTMDLTYTLKQDGDKLTGTVQGPQGDPLSIDNGKVDGGKATFTISFNGMQIDEIGTVNGDEFKLTVKSDAGSFPDMDLTLKRAKAAAPAK